MKFSVLIIGNNITFKTCCFQDMPQAKKQPKKANSIMRVKEYIILNLKLLYK